MVKRYIFEVGISAAINDPDDLVDVEIELTDEEHDQIYEAYRKYFWDHDDIPDHPLRLYLPEMNERIIRRAEPIAVAKWGEVARREKGACYEPFVPDDIVDEYLASDDFRAYMAAQQKHQVCPPRFH